MSNLEQFMNGLVALCNQHRIGIIFPVKGIGEIPEGKFVSLFIRDADNDIVPILSDVDLDSLVDLKDSLDNQ